MQSIGVYTTFPPAAGRTTAQHQRLVTAECQMAERMGWSGTLIYSDNRLLDPFVAAATVVTCTDNFVPLVAVNPIYSHPFAIARAISTISYLYERRVDINYVTGGFQRHLSELGCRLDHDERYGHLEEYAQIVDKLLRGQGLVSHAGPHYRLQRAAVTPPLVQERLPNSFVAGNSAAAIETARKIGAARLTYPHHIDTYRDKGPAPLASCGVRLGIIARDTAAAAWAVAHQRFPSDPVGEELHEIAIKQVQSSWHLDLSADAFRSSGSGVYWLYPFRAYKTLCPYLVGSHEEVVAALSEYFAAGVETIILDDLADADDTQHIAEVLRSARDRTAARHVEFSRQGDATHLRVEQTPVHHAVNNV